MGRRDVPPGRQVAARGPDDDVPGDGLSAGDPFDLGDLFDSFFGGGERKARCGADLRVDLHLDLIQAAEGCRCDVVVERDAACERCEGSGALPGSPASPCAGCGGSGRLRRTQGALVIEQICQDCDGIGRTGMRCPACGGRGVAHRAEDVAVTIPSGVADGQVLRIAGKGDAVRNGTPGYLYVVLHERRHPRLERRGNDLHVEVTIAPGATHARVPLLSGGEHELALPAGETTLVLRGQGVPIFGAPPTPPPPLAVPGESAPYRELDSSGRGDLIVHLRVAKENRLKTWVKRVLG